MVKGRRSVFAVEGEGTVAGEGEVPQSVFQVYIVLLSIIIYIPTYIGPCINSFRCLWERRVAVYRI